MTDRSTAAVSLAPPPVPGKGVRSIAEARANPYDDTRPRSSARTGEVVADDRQCLKCGYNIRGLPIGGVCPECGMPIVGVGGSNRYRKELPIDQVPRRYMKLLETGFMLLAFGGIGGVAVNTLWVFGGLSEAQGLVMSGGGLVAWTVGVLLVVRPRPLAEARKPGEVEWKWLRRVAVGSGVGALVLVGLGIALEPHWPLGAILALILHQLFSLVALCTTAVYASFLCDWASDTSLADRLRAMVWLIAFSALIMGMCLLMTRFGPSGLRGFAWIAMVLSTLVFVVSTLTVNIAWLQAISMATWAQRNARAAMEREIRRAERRRKEDAERLKYSDQSPLPAGMDLGARERFDAAQSGASKGRESQARDAGVPRPGQSTHRLQPSEELNPYDIED